MVPRLQATAHLAPFHMIPMRDVAIDVEALADGDAKVLGAARDGHPIAISHRHA
jgi:hypothetical protein